MTEPSMTDNELKFFAALLGVCIMGGLFYGLLKFMALWKYVFG